MSRIRTKHKRLLMTDQLLVFCRKKYDKAEAEFVRSKMNLHECQEKKELLTEHLATIIHKNEERKANKLEELIRTLDIQEQ